MGSYYAQLIFVCVVFVVGSVVTNGDDFFKVTTIKDERLSECSGLAASYLYPGFVWTHNDSGDKPRLFLVGADGSTKAVVRIDNADDFDWEDMCSFQIEGQSWLLIGDVGDNSRQRGKKHPKCKLYLLKEPALPKSKKEVEIEVDFNSRITFGFEDGPHDCEGIAVDIERREILLLTKSLPHKCGLYRLPLDLKDDKQKLEAEKIATPFILFSTALDISPDGRTMAIGSLLNGMLVRRQNNESWTEAFDHVGTPIDLPPRKQGETICFDTSGTRLLLNSEKKKQPLWSLKVPGP